MKMKKILIKIIKIYQSMPITSHFYCRFQPTCSNYMIVALNEYGVVKGLTLGIKRILKCRPGKHHGFDPVPLKKEKVL